MKPSVMDQKGQTETKKPAASDYRTPIDHIRAYVALSNGKTKALFGGCSQVELA